jgi:hypothetical protein
MIRPWVALALAAGCYSPCPARPWSGTCDGVSEPELGQYEVTAADSDCTGRDRSGCLEDAELFVEEDEIVLRFTDEAGYRWEASWVRTP